MSDNENALKAAAKNVTSIIQIVPEQAPASFITAGFVGHMTCAACSLDRRDSWMRCIGEAVEYMAQQRTPPDNIKSYKDETAWPDFVSKEFPAQDSQNTASLKGMNFITGEEVILPEFMCVGDSQTSGLVISSGCAAGSSSQSATLSSLHEIIERHIAQSWWHEAPRHSASMFDITNIPQVQRYIENLRQGNTQRITKIVQLDFIYGVYVTAAWSFLADGGDGFVCATAGRNDLMTSVRSSLHELIQLEWGQDLAANKLQKEVKKQSKHKISVNDPRLDQFENSKIFYEQSNKFSLPAQLDLITNQLDDAGLQTVGVLLHNENGLSVVKTIIETMILRKEIFT